RSPAWQARNERSAGNTKLFVFRSPTLRLRQDHDGAERARIGIEYEIVAQCTFPRDPQPVRDNDICGAPLEGDLVGFRGLGIKKVYRLRIGSPPTDHELLITAPITQ